MSQALSAAGTSLTAAAAGSTELEVDDTKGFAVGDTIAICPRCPNGETNEVAGIGSLILARPLQFDHAAGEPVVKLTLAVTPTSTLTLPSTPAAALTPSPTPTPTPTATPAPLATATATASATATPTPAPAATPAPSPTATPTAAPAATPATTPPASPTPGVVPVRPAALPTTGGGGASPSPAAWLWAVLRLAGVTMLMLAATAATLRSSTPRRWR